MKESEISLPGFDKESPQKNLPGFGTERTHQKLAGIADSKALREEKSIKPLPPMYVLKQINLYNWGPFKGRHRASIDPRGTAVIGPTGSGKTTLVDAFMTLVAAHPRYNLASTGGHESDRDLISYVRGVAGAGNNTGDMAHVTRNGKTTTALQMVFGNGDKEVNFGGLFWIDSSSFSQADLKKIWLFSETDELTMDEWLSVHHDGGSRALKQLGRETAGLHIFDGKKAYLARLRRFFEVGENAFALLNRAAGLKQLNSIDEIFRELVLDDRSAFHRAAEVVDEFQALATIRQELETARAQQKSLIPIQEKNRDYLTCEKEIALQRRLLRILPIWFALAGERLWGEKMAVLEENISKLKIENEVLNKKAQNLQSQVDMLQAAYLEAGGLRIEHLQEKIHDQKKDIAHKKRNLDDYRKLTHALNLDGTVAEESLEKNRQTAKARRIELHDLYQKKEERFFELGSDLGRHRQDISELKCELEKIKAHPGSNIPGRYQDFRDKLAGALCQPGETLPFVAELVEIKPEEQSWRGAVERAIGGNRLRILVPTSVMDQALHWINHRENRLHVRLLEAAAPEHQIRFFEDGFTRKLNFKKHPHREALKALLAANDRHCVASPEVLRSTPHGLTREGMMSGTRRLFEKQDQRALHEGWMTGFSNKDRLALLEARLKEMDEKKKRAQSLVDAAKKELKTLDGQRQLLNELEQLVFSDIDLPGSKDALNALEVQLRLLTDPDSDVSKKQQAHEKVKAALEALRQTIQALDRQAGALENQYAVAETYRNASKKRVGEGLDAEALDIGERYLPTLGQNDRRVLDEMERKNRQTIDEKRSRLEQRFAVIQQHLVRLMAGAKKMDTGALVESGTQLEDIPAYLERLRVLTREGLPEKRKRFLAYLNQSSDQGVTQLLTDVQNEVSIIEERIAELNRTLKRVDFQPGRYLQLNPTRLSHPGLKTLEAAQRRLRAAALKDEDDGSSQYRALETVIQLLQEAVVKKRTLGARSLLDPRYRLQFAVSVMDRKTDGMIESRTGSQGGSGGEKEIIASYILTASLSYALCPDGAVRPLFSTIVLDEAFSKSSQSVASRIIRALEEFDLHPLFVTPNKEMRLLRSHTRSAILVHRKEKEATLTSLSWEALETYAERKRG